MGTEPFTLHPLKVPYGVSPLLQGNNAKVYPIIGIIAGAISLATLYTLRLARGEQVVWNRKKNPAPWLSIKQDQTTKMYDPNSRFKEKWTREGL